MPRKLRVEYRTADSFRSEYARNISNGGIFIPSRHQIAIRDRVEVELVLAFEDRSVVLPGEVVHCIPPEMAETGAQPGVAIQFLADSDELRSKLGDLVGPGATNLDEREQGTGRRVAARSRAHVPADVEIDGEWVAGYTRNVSCSGVLIALPGQAPLVGRKVKLRIRLPSGGDEMKIGGQVARHVEASGATCIGVHFQVPEARVAELADFMERVRAVEHSRRLGGINGPIADLGIRSVLTMFGGSAPEGMLTLVRGDEEGYISFDRGMIRAQLGLLVGREALEALLGWNDGSFAFEGQLDEALVDGEPIPVAELSGSSGSPHDEAHNEAEDELVLLDLDELEAPTSRDAALVGGIEIDDDCGGADAPQLDALSISPDATLVASGRQDRSELCKTEEALLDLAAVGMTVAKAVEIIPEPDAEIYAALRTLVDEGFLTLA